MLLILFACDFTEDRSIIVNNKTDSPIYCLVTNSLIDNNSSKSDICIEILSNDFGGINPVRTRWESFIEKNKKKRIELYVFEKDTVEKYGWESSVIDERFSKKFLFTIADLDDIEWELNYFK